MTQEEVQSSNGFGTVAALAVGLGFSLVLVVLLVVAVIVLFCLRRRRRPRRTRKRDHQQKEEALHRHHSAVRVMAHCNRTMYIVRTALLFRADGDGKGKQLEKRDMTPLPIPGTART